MIPFKKILSNQVHVMTNPANNCAATAILRLAGWEADTRTANFTVTVKPVDNRFLNAAVIEWIDGGGGLWSSAGGPQLAGAVFEIIRTEPNEKNERGEPTRKLQIACTCRLYLDTDHWKELVGEGVVAVGWPN